MVANKVESNEIVIVSPEPNPLPVMVTGEVGGPEVTERCREKPAARTAASREESKTAHRAAKMTSSEMVVQTLDRGERMRCMREELTFSTRT